MLPYITWDVDPVLVSLGNIRIAWYSLLLTGGFLLAYFVFRKVAIHEKADLSLIEKFSIWTILWTVTGLRLGHCLFYDWSYFQNHLLEILIPFQQEGGSWQFTGFRGLASHGGVIGIVLFTLYFAYRKKIRLLWLLDRIAIAVPIVAFCVRCGNLMNSEIIGTVTDLPWGFKFVHADGAAAPARHPSQLYEALVYLMLFFYQLWYYFKRSKGKIPAGRSVGTLLTVIFTARFLIEFVKENQSAFESNMTLNMGQWLSIPFIVFGITCLIWSVCKRSYPVFTRKQPDNHSKS
jgi:prolipoprotein diacylglyceryl transferase